MLLIVIEQQSGNEIAVNVLLIWDITLFLATVSSGHFPPRAEDNYKKANVTNFSAPSLHLQLVGKYLVSATC